MTDSILNSIAIIAIAIWTVSIMFTIRRLHRQNLDCLNLIEELTGVVESGQSRVNALQAIILHDPDRLMEVMDSWE